MILLVYIDFVANWAASDEWPGLSICGTGGNMANESWCYPSIWSNRSLGLV